VGGTVLRVLEAAKSPGTRTGHEQKQRRGRRSLQAGEVVHNALAEKLIPTTGRQHVESFVEAQVSAGNEIRIGLDNGIRIGEHFERQDLFAFLLALGAGNHVPLELVDLIVGQLPIGCSDHVFVCKFAIHGYVLLAPKNSY
jgi:hypothetical protein